ncbi:MAG: DUF3592 domain-containing protein [Clostridia bacterium]|nr:DUF3592 domain-containing protein [Clostridia bacterium]
MAVAGFTFFLLGVVLLICYPIGKRKNKRCSAQTQGVFVGTKARYNSKGSLPDMKYYTYSVNGVAYQIKSTAYNSQVDKVGDTCTIWYNPKNPAEAQEFHYEKSSKTYTIILICGIVCVVLGFVLPIIGIGMQA